MEWVSGPLVPVIVKVYEPWGVVRLVVTASPDEVQLLRRERYLFSAEQFLQLFQLHCVFLDFHQWLRRRVH